MALKPRFFTDTNIAAAVAYGLRAQGVDVLRAEDVGLDRVPDPDILAYVEANQLTLITHDVRIWDHHAQWLWEGRHHYGIFACHATLQSNERSGEIIRQILEYHQYIVAGAASVEHDLFDQFIRLS